MKHFLIVFLVCLSVQISRAQSTNDFMVSSGFDIVKTDNANLFSKAQIGLELNYFVVRHFAVGGGAEFWVNRNSYSNSFVMGMRWYADENFFFRFRGLIGANDASLGVGWSKAIGTNWRFEAIGDFYFHREFALRAGVSYVIK